MVDPQPLDIAGAFFPVPYGGQYSDGYAHGSGWWDMICPELYLDAATTYTLHITLDPSSDIDYASQVQLYSCPTPDQGGYDGGAWDTFGDTGYILDGYEATITIGPGLRQWDAAMAAGEHCVIFESRSGTHITGITISPPPSTPPAPPEPPINDDLASAMSLFPEVLATVSPGGATMEVGEPNIGGGGRTTWWRFIASAAGPYVFHFGESSTPGNVHAAAYTASVSSPHFADLTVIPTRAISPGDPFIVVELAAGQPVWLQVDFTGAMPLLTIRLRRAAWGSWTEPAMPALTVSGTLGLGNESQSNYTTPIAWFVGMTGHPAEWVTNHPEMVTDPQVAWDVARGAVTTAIGRTTMTQGGGFSEWNPWESFGFVRPEAGGYRGYVNYPVVSPGAYQATFPNPPPGAVGSSPFAIGAIEFADPGDDGMGLRTHFEFSVSQSDAADATATVVDVSSENTATTYLTAPLAYVGGSTTSFDGPARAVHMIPNRVASSAIPPNVGAGADPSIVTTIDSVDYTYAMTVARFRWLMYEAPTPEAIAGQLDNTRVRFL